jgi:hypothetical protein
MNSGWQPFFFLTLKQKRPDEMAAEAALLPLFRYQISINR